MQIKNIFLFLTLILLFSKSQATRFNGIKNIDEEKRVTAATEIYKTQLRKTDSVYTFQQLQELVKIARELKDKKLECAVFSYKADYYSYNYGVNSSTPAYFKQCILFAEDNGLKAEKGIYIHLQGTYYFIEKDYTTAYRYYLKAQDIFNEVGMQHIPNVGFYISELANFYYRLGDLENAQENLLKSLRFNATYRDSLSVLNTLGLIKRTTGEYAAALDYFHEVVNLAIIHGDSTFITLGNGNIGSVFFLKNEYRRALPYLEFDYYNSLKYVDAVNAAAALLRIIHINLIKKEHTLVAKQLDEAEFLIGPAKDLQKWIDFYKMKATLFEQTNRFEKAIEFRKKYEMAVESLAKQNNTAAVERVKLQWVQDKHLSEISDMDKIAKNKVAQRNSIIFILFLLIIISTLLYNRQRNKRKTDKEIFIQKQALLESEKLRAEVELKNASEALDNYTENLRKKTELVESFKSEMEIIRQQLDDRNHQEDKTDTLEKLMEANIMTNENWDEFKRLFSKVYTDFFFNLKAKYPGLTETDVRLSTLIKLQLNNREMSNMLGVTPDGIKKARQRLRKKIYDEGKLSVDELIRQI